MSQPDVIVVGGGLGGLGVAFSLTRQGRSVRLLERAPAFGEVGAGIQLAPNCTRILDDYGLLEEAKSLGVVPDAMVMRDAVDGDELTRLDLRDWRSATATRTWSSTAATCTACSCARAGGPASSWSPTRR